MQECCILEVSSCETIISLAQYVYLIKLSNECRNNNEYKNAAAAFLFIRVLLLMCTQNGAVFVKYSGPILLLLNSAKHYYQAFQPLAQYIFLDSKLFQVVVIRFLPGWSGAEIKCTMHVDLPKQSIDQFKLDQQIDTGATSLSTVLIYTLCSGSFGKGQRLRQCVASEK